MQKKISKLPFKGTAEQKQKLLDVIDTYKSDPSRLMTVMQEAQEIYGYLPIEVQQMIADGMNLPLEKEYGVATFPSVWAPPAMSRDRATCSTRSAKCWGSARTNARRMEGSL